MLKTEDAILNKDSEEGQFLLLCDYGDIVTSRSTIVSNETFDKFYLYKVIEPFPTFEEYSRGDEFEEGELIKEFDTWEDAKIAQNYRKRSP